MWEYFETHKKYYDPNAVVKQKPGEICTFADCPNREENLHDEPASGGDYDGYCPLGARRMDFSYCHHPKVSELEQNSKHEWCYAFCEVAVREGICPRGFTR